MFLAVFSSVAWNFKAKFYRRIFYIYFHVTVLPAYMVLKLSELRFTMLSPSDFCTLQNLQKPMPENCTQNSLQNGGLDIVAKEMLPLNSSKLNPF